MKYRDLTEKIREVCLTNDLGLSVYAFGSGLGRPEDGIETDYDILVLGGQDQRGKLETLLTKATGMPIRKSIKDPKTRIPYIHFLGYEDETDFRKNEWPTVVNNIVQKHYRIAGEPLSETLIEIDNEEQVLGPLQEALGVVLKSGDPADFRRYLDKIIPKLREWYPAFERRLEEFYEQATHKTNH